MLPGSAAAHSLIRPAGAVVSYLSADATSLNTLRVAVNGNRIEFRDETVDGGMDPGACTPGDLDRSGYIIQTFCALGGVQRVRIDLGEREDTATVALPVAATVLGGPGADRLGAGEAGDEIDGGEGNDAVSAGGGDDLISGGTGADELDGGPGADRLVARDGLTDVVRCGDGADVVDADTLDTVALDCENVTRTGTAAPAPRTGGPRRSRWVRRLSRWWGGRAACVSTRPRVSAAR
jgi:Ca2+-binding RTX toxin-like protein